MDRVISPLLELWALHNWCRPILWFNEGVLVEEAMDVSTKEIQAFTPMKSWRLDPNNDGFSKCFQQ